MLAADINRFWAKVNRTGQCWVWTGALSYGYGSIRIARRARAAHRVAFELEVGPLADGNSVLHRCDNRACVRPDHLFSGTHIDNMRDMVAKGRSARKLSESAVARVLELSAAGMPRRKVAKLVGISSSQVQNIASGRQRADRL